MGLGTQAYMLLTNNDRIVKPEIHILGSLWWLLLNHSQNGLSWHGKLLSFKQMPSFQTYSAYVAAASQRPRIILE